MDNRYLKLDDIEAFNGLFYKNCFYNSIFTIIKYYNLDISPLLIEDVFQYNFQVLDDQINLELINKEIKSPKKIIEDLGVNINSKLVSDNIINDIEAAISSNNPVVIWVDCFYESIRKDTYQQIHWPHTLIIYGFSKEGGYFKIIEHDKRETLTYRKRTISYFDLVNSYEGFRKYCCKFSIDTFYEMNFQSENALTIEKNIYSKRYLKNIVINMENIVYGIETLKGIDKYIIKMLENNDKVNKQIENVLMGLNNILNVKNAMLFTNSQILGPSNKLNETLGEIISRYKRLRDVLMKYYYSNKYPKERVIKEVDFKSIYDFEIKYNEIILGEYQNFTTLISQKKFIPK